MELKLTTQKEGEMLTVFLSGELNTNTAPELRTLLETHIPKVNSLFLDFTDCDFVSSAGLRVLLASFKSMKSKSGIMKLRNVGNNFSEVLNITGLDAVFDIE